MTTDDKTPLQRLQEHDQRLARLYGLRPSDDMTPAQIAAQLRPLVSIDPGTTPPTILVYKATACGPTIMPSITPAVASLANQIRDSQDEEEREYQAQRAAWQLGDYVGACPNCGRSRLCQCPNGKRRCEKCNWCPEDGAYAPDV